VHWKEVDSVQLHVIVPDPGSRDRVVVLIGMGCWGNRRRDAGIWKGGNGEGLRKGRLVYK
jgi:hypothetical protein